MNATETKSGNPYFRAIEEGRTTYEHKVGHILCRFYQHENGGWSCMISSVGGVSIIHHPTKRETWDEARRIAGTLQALDVKAGHYDMDGKARPFYLDRCNNPANRPSGWGSRARRSIARPCPKL